MPQLKPKDIPVFATALHWADVFLTLDQEDFGVWIGGTVDGLRVLRPSDFLIEAAKARRSSTLILIPPVEEEENGSVTILD